MITCRSALPGLKKEEEMKMANEKSGKKDRMQQLADAIGQLPEAKQVEVTLITMGLINGIQLESTRRLQQVIMQTQTA